VLTGPGRLGLLPEGTVLDLSWLELTVGLGLGWGAALLFGLAPAWLTSKTDVLAALRTSRQATAPRTISFLRASLVAVQVLMAVVILSGAGILIRSFANVIALPLGFEPRGLVAANVYVDAPSDARADVGRLERALRARLGGASLTIANSMPFFGYTGSTNFALLPDETTVPDWDHSQIRTVLPSYFSTMRTPLIRGRLLTSDDAGVQPTPVLVNETFAQKFGGGQDILGRRLLRAWLGGGSPPQDNQMVIVGVLQDARVIGWLSTPREAVYTLLDSSRAGL
jgi:hypothetical protein